MKKILKIIFILFILIVIILASIGIYFKCLHQSVPSNYIDIVKVMNESIEKEYIRKGNYESGSKTIKLTAPSYKISIYYPKNLQNLNQLPTIISVNGSGTPASKYKSWFKHMASHGFIVLGNEDHSTGRAFSIDQIIDYLKVNDDSKLKFITEKIDWDKIGIVGHSQGGAGTLAAASVRKYHDLYKAVVALSPTHELFAHQLNWDYDLTKITAPVMILAGSEGKFETEVVSPIDKLQSIMLKIKTDKVLARKKDIDHGQMLYSGDGYVTAWFKYWLYDDQKAGKFFKGINPEIIRNPLYQDVEIDVKN